MAALHITKENFESEVLKSDKPVLVDFWAAWCGPCQMLLPTIEELAGEVTDAKICKINVDEQPELAAQFRVMTIPTLMVFKDGKAVNTSVGVKPKNAILDMIRA
ncbi:MAG: thioredoxin [Clostridiales bacterium]|nr:thioredoxin [Roseburia sp.]MDD7638346.1 thioredoxin [Clostridiales bacterium]MDY4111341.1 thioredoxin [Roseburia sp.]